MIQDCWNDVEKFPELSETLTTCVTAGKVVDKIDWRRVAGMGSRGHVVGRLH